MRVSSAAAEQAIVATGFPFRRKDLLDRYERAFAAALRRFEDLRRVGAASLDLCWTAEGVFDGFFELRLGPVGRRRGRRHRAGGRAASSPTGRATTGRGSGRATSSPAPPAVHEALLEIASSTR